jgi:hypothetical protein
LAGAQRLSSLREKFRKIYLDNAGPTLISDFIGKKFKNGTTKKTP